MQTLLTRAAFNVAAPRNCGTALLSPFLPLKDGPVYSMLKEVRGEALQHLFPQHLEDWTGSQNGRHMLISNVTALATSLTRHLPADSGASAGLTTVTYCLHVTHSGDTPVVRSGPLRIDVRHRNRSGTPPACRWTVGPTAETGVISQ